ncbi:MAG TPA: hypothetical protein ENI77_10310 [Nitrospirae bacterium]|nr:hypothetical protein [Nitrospirota bacterium]
MKKNVLVKSDEYTGQYVAQPDFDQREVIAANKDPEKTYDEAVSKGYEHPVVFYVPEKGTANIY